MRVEDLDKGIWFLVKHFRKKQTFATNDELVAIGRLVRLVIEAQKPVALSGLTDPGAPEEREAWLKEAKELVGGCHEI